MDSLFLLEKNARISLLKTIAQAFGCTYICLWSYLPPPDHCLFSMEGWCNEDYNRPSSSTSSFPKRLFDEYRQSFYTIENSCVPGFAFKEGLPYLELHDTDLLNLASNETQRQFYQEAGIKTAVFNGCKTGEIELGMSIPPQFNMEMEIRKLFAEDFIQQFQLREAHLPDQSRPSSSSSSLRSLSMGSPEYSALGQVNTVSTSYMTDAFQETPIHRATKPTFVPLPTHHQSMQAYSQCRNFQLPTPASADAAMARAMIAVMSSPSSSSSAYEAQQPHRSQHQATNQRGAFKRYVPSLTPKIEIKPKSHSQNMIMRALAYLRTMKAPTPETRPTGPTSNQLHHMISERKRREKLNESFQALKSLLPPGSKKDKASVLANTRLYLSSLKDQVSELQEKNRLLEIQLAPTNAANEEVDIGNERTVIRVTEASESSSESRVIELHVMVREQDCEIVDLILHLLECLNQMQGVSFVSMEADTQLRQADSFHRAILRLKIKAGDWNEESFKEAMTRAVADVARRKTSGS